MSVYSGFATRHQEDMYNKLASKTVSLMAEKLASYRNIIMEDGESQVWLEQIMKLYQYMKTMENYKYLEPKFSYHMRKLCDRTTKFKVSLQLNHSIIIAETKRND